jgi:hypothetical protein
MFRGVMKIELWKPTNPRSVKREHALPPARKARARRATPAPRLRPQSVACALRETRGKITYQEEGTSSQRY